MAGERELPGLGGVYGYWTPGTGGYGTQVSDSLRKLSVMAQLRIKSRVAALPASPANGDIHIVTTDQTIAVRDNGSWVSYPAAEGMLAYDTATNELLFHNGEAWAVFLNGATIAALYETVADRNPFTDAAEAIVAELAGGLSGQVLTKASDTSGDFVWAAGGGGGGGGSGSLARTTVTGDHSITNADLSGLRVIYGDSATAQVITVPPGLTGSEPVTVIRLGAGAVTFSPGVGVTIRSANSLLQIGTRYSSVSLIPSGTTDVYDLIGNLA